MADQLHKRFSDAEIKSLLKRYVAKELPGKRIRQMLDIKERMFLSWSKITHFCCTRKSGKKTLHGTIYPEQKA